MSAIDPEDMERFGIRPARMEAPYLAPGFDAAWQAWRFLNPFRSHTAVGMSGIMPGPIPLGEIIAYMDLRGVPKEYRLELADQIGIIDQEYVSWAASKK
ncbi:MAG: hypothetical protein HY788_08530 [Deltaproteobacteria bacterium]|nr:hypothetical protein [Deltaproteobacteria bacterium]